MSRSANDEESETDPGWSRARHQLFAMIMDGRSFSGRERNCCFLNTRQQRFATISAISGLDFPDDGRCLAITDWDRDGDQDVWISNRNAPRLRFMRNDTPRHNHFLSIWLVGNGTATNRDAIGARVDVEVRKSDQRNKAPILSKTLRAGEGFLSQSSKCLHFGLGDATTVERVTVHWPGGGSQTYTGLEIDSRYRLFQQETNAVPVPSLGNASALRAGEAKLPVQSRIARVVLETRVPMPTVAYENATGSLTTERFDSGQPTLVNLWASWCQPCVQELADFSTHRKELESAGVRVISLSVDGIGSEPTPDANLQAFIKRVGYPFKWGHIDAMQMDQLQELNNQFFFLRRTLPLPSSFLIDAEGNLSVIYKGPLSVTQLLKDARLPRGDYHTSAEQAACLPGQSLKHERIREVATRTERLTRYRVATWLESKGNRDQARVQLHQMAHRDPTWPLPERRLANLYLDDNQLVAAKRHAARALELAPGDANAHNTLGLVASRQGDRRRAESHFRESTKLDPTLAGPYNNLGIVLAMQGKINIAGQAFRRAVELDDQFAEAHANLGNVHASRNEPKQAIEHYQRAIEIDPNYVDAYNNLGTLFGRLGEIERAIEYYQHALRIAPQNQDTQRNLNRALEVWNSRSRR